MAGLTAFLLVSFVFAGNFTDMTTESDVTEVESNSRIAVNSEATVTVHRCSNDTASSVEENEKP